MIWRESENKNSSETLDEKKYYLAFLLAIVNFSSSPFKGHGLILFRPGFYYRLKVHGGRSLGSYHFLPHGGGLVETGGSSENNWLKRGIKKK